MKQKRVKIKVSCALWPTVIRTLSSPTWASLTSRYSVRQGSCGGHPTALAVRGGQTTFATHPRLPSSGVQEDRRPHLRRLRGEIEPGSRPIVYVAFIFTVGHRREAPLIRRHRTSEPTEQLVTITVSYAPFPILPLARARHLAAVPPASALTPEHHRRLSSRSPRPAGIHAFPATPAQPRASRCLLLARPSPALAPARAWLCYRRVLVTPQATPAAPRADPACARPHTRPRPC